MRLWCGVVFCIACSACGRPDVANSPSQRVLTVGFPEAAVPGTEVGLAQLINVLTLEGLTQTSLSVDGRALPRLAESWNWEDEGRRLRLQLRSGVTFHDGTAFTSTVAAEALNRAIARASTRALYPSVADVTSVRPEGDLQLVLDLSRPSAFLPEDLDLPLSIGPNNVGTGAFRRVARATGVELERFDRYYAGAPKIERIVIRPSDNLRTSWSRLLRGEVDMVTDVPPEAVEFIQNDDIQVISFARSFQFLIAFNSQSPVFRSAAVRRALNAAVNREALIARVLQGHGEAASGPLWPRHWAYDGSAQPFRFDPGGAEASLELAGLHLPATARGTPGPPARLRFTCLLPADFTLLERIGLDVQKQLYDVGVDMMFEVVPIQDYDARIREGRFQAVLVDMISGPTFARPHVFWGAPRRDGLHAFGYDNAEAARLFDVLRTSINEGAVRSAVSRLQRVLLEDPPALFLAWNQRARAVRRHFRVPTSDRDPLFTIWQWTENTDSQSVSTK
ncbi:MAG: ABC transporter substrate-binding protein [Acidobacteria bacterium]|nr:ABC transporter substrate-binding protein [Acidobacteriota bacterium]